MFFRKWPIRSVSEISFCRLDYPLNTLGVHTLRVAPILLLFPCPFLFYSNLGFGMGMVIGATPLTGWPVKGKLVNSSLSKLVLLKMCGQCRG